jgi:hypothetical protein
MTKTARDTMMECQQRHLLAAVERPIYHERTAVNLIRVCLFWAGKRDSLLLGGPARGGIDLNALIRWAESKG